MLGVFENRMPRKTFGSKQQGLTGSWRKLHVEELCGLYSLQTVIWLIKFSRMRSVGHAFTT
jgi:hypothetical protein